MYHGANSFAKENHRETIHAGFGCNYPVYHNRGASKYGRSARTHLYPRRLHPAVRKELRRVSQLKRSNFSAIVHCSAPMNWHKVLFLFLWISPHMLLGVLVVVLCKRRLYREFPCFLAYVFYEIAEFILLFTLYLFALYSVAGVTANQYAYAYSATLPFNIALRFGVIDEVCKDLFRDSQFLKVAARRSLLCVTGLLLGVGVLLAVYAPGGNSVRWFAGVLAVNRGAAVVQSGLLLSLLLFSRFLGLSWRRPAFGIALGLGVLTSVYLANYALRAEFTSRSGADFLNLLTTGTYLVCVSIWIGYLLAPEPEPASLAVVPHDEVETWNTELQQLLRD